MPETSVPTGARLQEVRRAFESALGADKVFFTPLDGETYRDPFALDETGHHPAGAIAPASAEEIRAALRIANQYRMPLWPVSRGKNLGYGGSAPVLAGTVVMDLSRMKGIEFDAGSGTVIVEPGVSFYDLYDYLQANRLPFWISPGANDWGSVMGTALDRGQGATPYGDHARRICGMEVLLADGTAVRTGMGALANSPDWALFPHGYGPGWDQMFCQSNFGVVTRLGLSLMPEPESVLGMDVEFARPDDLQAIVDALVPLRREGLLQHDPVIANWLARAAVQTTRAEWSGQPGPLSGEAEEAIRAALGLGWWGVSLRLWGREAVNRAAYGVLEQAVAAIQPSAVQPTVWRRGEGTEHSVWTGTPTTQPLQMIDWHGGRGGYLPFTPVLPANGTRAVGQLRRTQARFREYEMDHLTSFVVGERHLVNANTILFDRRQPAMMARVDPLFRTLAADAARQGYGERRTHVEYMDVVADGYGFNDGALGRLNRAVKNALDPNGILAPGKSGIWPGDAVNTEERP